MDKTMNDIEATLDVLGINGLSRVDIDKIKTVAFDKKFYAEGEIVADLSTLRHLREVSGPWAITGENVNNHFVYGGYVAPGYQELMAAFQRNFAVGLELNSQLCCYHNGRCVINVFGRNESHPLSTINYDINTLQIVFSSTKAVTSLAMAIAADKGYFKYDDKVCKHWPQFATNGKSQITIADIMRHDSGLSYLDEQITIDDIESISDPSGSLAKKFERSSAEKDLRIYHALTRGWLCSFILQRTDPKNRNLQQFINEFIASPLKVDFHCGISHELQQKKQIAILHQQNPKYIFANCWCNIRYLALQ